MGLRTFFGRLALTALVAPHVLGCATTTTTNWELTQRADALAPAAEIRSTCGGTEACAALCESIMDHQMDDPRLAKLCETDRGDSFGIASCQPRGQDLLITCYMDDESKGACTMPDS